MAHLRGTPITYGLFALRISAEILPPFKHLEPENGT